jgi:hypothetical protein
MASGSSSARSIAPVSIDLKSAYALQVQLTNVAGNKVLPNITVRGVPTYATVYAAEMWVKVWTIENTNALVNSVVGVQNIQVQMAVGGAWLTAIPLPAGSFSVPANTTYSGDVMYSSVDISPQVPVNGQVMNFQWALGLSAQNNLNFNMVQVGVRIWYTV